MKPRHRIRRQVPRVRALWQALLLIVFFALAAVVAALLEPAPPDLTGRATVADGDTLRLGADRIRLTGLDAPELAQTCRDSAGDDWPCGRASTQRLSALVKGKTLHCSSSGKDRYGRFLGRCTVGGKDLGAILVAEGLAVAEFPDYGDEERSARAARRGIWVGSFDLPRHWRETHGAIAEGFDFLGWIRSWLR